MIGQTVSHYQIEEQRGQGRMGWKRANSKPLTNLRLCNPLTQVTMLTLYYYFSFLQQRLLKRVSGLLGGYI